jgi:Protein of unknown function (DUF2975)
MFDDIFLLFYDKQMPISLTASTLAAQTALSRRLRGLCLAVRALVLVGAPVLLAVPLLYAFAPQAMSAAGFRPPLDELSQLAQGGVTDAVRQRAALVALLPVSVSLWLLWQLWGLFGEYRQGAVFSPRALACLRRFALGLLALGLVQPAARALGSVAVSWDNPPGQRLLVVSLDSGDYALLLVALVFIAIARVMTEAARVAEENEGFV